MAKAHPGLDAAYAAGILDGEGCLDIHYDKRNNSFYPRVRVEMTQYETVQWLQDRWPGVKVQFVTRKKNLNHSATFRWCVQGPKSLDFIKEVLPFLQAKKQEAELFLQFPYEDTPRKGRKLSMEIVEKRKDIKEQLSGLKTKGKGLLIWSRNI